MQLYQLARIWLTAQWIRLRQIRRTEWILFARGLAIVVVTSCSTTFYIGGTCFYTFKESSKAVFDWVGFLDGLMLGNVLERLGFTRSMNWLWGEDAEEQPSSRV